MSLYALDLLAKYGANDNVRSVPIHGTSGIKYASVTV